MDIFWFFWGLRIPANCGQRKLKSYAVRDSISPLPARGRPAENTMAANLGRSTTGVAQKPVQGGSHGNDVPEFPRYQIQRNVGEVVHWFKLQVTFNGFRSPTIPKEAIDVLKPLLTDDRKKRLTEVDESGSINLQLPALHPRGEAQITIHRTYAGKGSFKISRGWSEVRDGNNVKANGTSVLDLWLPNQNPVTFIVISLRGLQSPEPPTAAGSILGV